jgi:GT2 family glycosyltransferase
VRYNNSVAQARNQIAEEALHAGCEWIFWLDDDLLFAKDVLTKLLRRPEAIVIGMTLMRCTRDGTFRPIWSNTKVERVPGRKVLWEAVNGIETGPNGLMALQSGTGGGVLTRREVFEKVPAPWWQMGQHDPEMFWEDIFFYEQATAAGVPVWGDPSVRFGHYSPTVLWPNQRADGTWSTVVAHGFEGFLEQPWPMRELVMSR